MHAPCLPLGLKSIFFALEFPQQVADRILISGGRGHHHGVVKKSQASNRSAVVNPRISVNGVFYYLPQASLW